MKANSHHNPGHFTKSAGKLFFNFNIVETEEEGVAVFTYDYVEVKDKKKGTLIKAVMKNKYSIEKEISMINNKFRGDEKDLTDYTAYQNFRTAARLIAEDGCIE